MIKTTASTSLSTLLTGLFYVYSLTSKVRKIFIYTSDIIYEPTNLYFEKATFSFRRLYMSYK